jgi:hypothetical protein
MERASKTIQLLTRLGIQINQKKSLNQPQQQVTYLGHIWDLKENKIRPQMPKIQDALKNIKHQLKGKVTTPKHIAATAGQLLDQAKSNVSLWGLTRQLMKQAGKAVSIIRFHNPHFNLIKAWSKSLPRARLPHLNPILQQCTQALLHPTPLQFRPNSPLEVQLQTDASDRGWGACLIQNGKEIANCAQEWDEYQRELHITHREGLASALAVHHLKDHIPQNSTLNIQADVSSTNSTWGNRSKIHGMNKHILQQLTDLNQKWIRVMSTHIAGTKKT